MKYPSQRRIIAGAALICGLSLMGGTSTVLADVALSGSNPGPYQVGLVENGISLNGISLNVISPNGISPNGISLNVISPNGVSPNGMSPNGVDAGAVAANRGKVDPQVEVIGIELPQP